MKARLVKFGEIEVEGKRYTHDVMIDGGKVRKRKKGPSKQFREEYGHTPLSVGEKIPWGGKRLIVGTGAHGALPVMDEVLTEAKQARDRGYCEAHIGSLSPTGGSDEGSGVRHLTLYVLTEDPSYGQNFGNYPNIRLRTDLREAIRLRERQPTGERLFTLRRLD